MDNFILKYLIYTQMKKYGKYRFCWIPFDNNGNGLYSVIELFDYEIKKLDPKKIQIIQL